MIKCAFTGHFYLGHREKIWNLFVWAPLSGRELLKWWYGDLHYDDVIMDAIASQITSLTIVYSTVYSDADQRKHQSSASLAFAWGIHRGLVNSPHKWPVTRKMFPFDDVIMFYANFYLTISLSSPASSTREALSSWNVITMRWMNCDFAGNFVTMINLILAKQSTKLQTKRQGTLTMVPKWPLV